MTPETVAPNPLRNSKYSKKELLKETQKYFRVEHLQKKEHNLPYFAQNLHFYEEIDVDDFLNNCLNKLNVFVRELNLIISCKFYFYL